jgi:hypothetical protein
MIFLFFLPRIRPASGAIGNVGLRLFKNNTIHIGELRFDSPASKIFRYNKPKFICSLLKRKKQAIEVSDRSKKSVISRCEIIPTVEQGFIIQIHRYKITESKLNFFYLIRFRFKW